MLGIVQSSKMGPHITLWHEEALLPWTKRGKDRKIFANIVKMDSRS